ncbi:hypothetical protein MEBOL_003994 [Melittangium boletus DSM 14713]|uniref:CHAT domain-containing protein n=2 Tax=Melittangium boletus TaxID=83453 RepID=A0A250IH27_9BACT|nr:hypothetical protein MEBOL_003994 [Melittangium boletus DSM 14713]
MTQAEPLLQRALAIQETAPGDNRLARASTLSALAGVHWARGLYGQAESLSVRALALREEALGKDHPDVAASLNNLAAIYFTQKLYDEAEPLMQRALTLYEANLGKTHIKVADSLNNLAGLYFEQGLYGRVEPLMQRVLDIRETVLGKTHPDVAVSLNNLAMLYSRQGLYIQAESLFLRAIDIEEAVLGKTHPEVATLLNNLANLYAKRMMYDRAVPLSQRALDIREVALDKAHPNVADSLNDLASLYREQGLYEQAEPLFQRALNIGENGLDKTHTRVATSVGNLASLYLDLGRYEQAEPLFQRALSLMESTLGKEHPDIALLLGDFAQLRMAQNRLEEAVPLYTRAFAISEQRLRQEALDFSESRLSGFLRHLRSAEETLYALLRTHPENAQVRRLALSAALLLKGRSVEETASISHTLYRHLGADDRDTLEKLRDLRARLASLSLVGPGVLAPEDYQQQLKTLTAEGDTLEADLAKRSAPLRIRTALPRPAEIVERVAASLPTDGALVEFIAYQDSPLVPRPGTPKAQAPRQLRYLALVLLPDASTRAVDLGPADSIDAAASRMRDALARRDASFLLLAQALYRRAFQPLLPLLGTTRRLLLSPDGQLGLVPFAALHDGRNFLIDTFDVTYLTSGRELLPSPQSRAPLSSVLVLADPDFSAPFVSAPSSSDSNALERFFARSDLARGTWERLPGTREEAQGIKRLLPQADLLLGAEATKERLMALPTPGILHLATHGFFLGDPPGTSGSRGVGSLALPDGPPPPQPEPLLNSGLVLAGAFTSRSNATLLTALELAGFDLWGTQLVVLSACDTGLGEVHLGQGIYGLRRALVVAGAETVVSSLWAVNDGSTQQLMGAYYRNLLAGQGRASALREAMRALRRTHPHPYHWAPFIVLGSGAPLRGITPGTP